MTRSHSAFIAVAVLIVASTSACSRSGHDASFRWTNALPAGSVIHIRDRVGSINVKSGPGTQAIVNGSRSWRRGRSRDVEFVVNQSGSDYYVCAMWRNSGDCEESGYKNHSSRGILSILSIFSLFRHGSDTQADFDVTIPASVRVDAKTQVGSVTIDGASAGVSAQSANGSVTASNVSGPLVLTTANGSVHVSAIALAPTDSVELSTANGNVRAELPANIDGNFDLRTTNGTVKSDFPLTPTSKSSGPPKHLTGQIGTSTRVVNMRTANGSVVVTTRPSTASQ